MWRKWMTPFISIIRELIFISYTQTNKTLPRILLICVFKKSHDLTMLDLMLPDSGAGMHNSGLKIQIQAYVTGEKEPAIEDPKQKLIKVLLFKPSASDAPFSATLGSNNYLWLGITIGFSFLIFLLFLGILTRFYIYPADKISKSAITDPLKDALSMLCVFSAVVVSATAAFMWKKKEMMNEKWVENGAGELEIFPDVSLVKATQVHYGQRPNSKRILTECGKSRTGVLVSGPKKMRQEVAELCSSHLFQHVHFESISFTW